MGGVKLTKGGVIPLLFLIILTLNVLAVPPFQTSATEESNFLTIVYPQSLQYELKTKTTLPFDILDSNYTRLTNSNVNCSFFAVDFKGLAISSGNLTYDTSLMYWYYNLTEAETYNVGTFSFYVYCSSASLNENGFISLTYDVIEEPTGFDKIYQGWFFFAYLIIMFVLIAFMHTFKDDGVTMVYGMLGGSVSFIMLSMMLVGFKVVDNLKFIIDVNWYLGILVASIGLYCFIVGYHFLTEYKEEKGRREVS